MLETINNLGEGALAATLAIWTEIAAFVPNLIAALIILLVGYAVAKIVSALLRRLLVALGFDTLSERVGLSDMLTRINVEQSASSVLARVVFWILMLTFLLSASESLNLERLSATINSLVEYLPRVLGAIFFLAIGLFVATLARDAVRAGAKSLDSRHVGLLGQATYFLLMVFAIALAISQLNLESQLLTNVISVAVAAAGIAAALAFGLGARDVAGHLLAGAYLRDTYPPGIHITTGEVQGSVKRVDALGTVVATGDGQEIVVPNAALVNLSVRVSLLPADSDETMTEDM